MSAIIYDLNKFRKTHNRALSQISTKEIISMEYDDRPEFNDALEHHDHMVNCIAARYGVNQPKGGVVYQTPVHGMKLDSYGRGNAHSSVFQYMPKSKSNWNNPMPFPSDLRKVFKALEKNKNKVMALGYKSDPLMWMDQKYEQTKAIIKHATLNNVTLVINTMSDLCAHDDYIELLKAGEHSITMNMSLNDGNEQLERLLSPGAPSLKRRSSAIQKLKECGVDVSITETKQITVDYEIQQRTGYGIGYVIKQNDNFLQDEGAV